MDGGAPDRAGPEGALIVTVPYRPVETKRSAAPIPDFQTLMRPVLELHAGGADHESATVVASMADHFELSADERVEMLPLGGQKLLNNRVAWSITHMAQAGLLERPRRGATRITDRGQKVLAENPDRVDMKVLNQFADYREFRSRKRRADKPADGPDLSTADAPPLELIPQLVAEAHTALADELIERLRQAPPQFLEHCVLKLLERMGYGGPEGEVRHLGGPGDEGMDGLIRQDALGLDVVYVQPSATPPAGQCTDPTSRHSREHSKAPRHPGVSSLPPLGSHRAPSTSPRRFPQGSP
jgi:restriction system protein